MRTPKYRNYLNRLGFVEFKRKRYYFPGKYESEESYKAYQAFVLKHVIKGEPISQREPESSGQRNNTAGQSIASLVIKYMDKVIAKRFDKTDPKSEYHAYRFVFSKLVDFAGHKNINDFGSSLFMEFQEELVEQGQSATTIKHKTGKIKRMFRWGHLKEMVSANTLTAVNAVPNVDPNRIDVKKPVKTHAIAWEVVERTLEFVTSPIVKAMVAFHWWTGARSTNIGQIKPGEIDRSGDVWHWVPGRHKNSWRGQELTISIGPQAQKSFLIPTAGGVLDLLNRADNDFCFSPRESERLRCGNNLPYPYMKRFYSATAYSRAIVYALTKQAGLRVSHNSHPSKREIEDQGVEWWHPHQLRHSRCTIVREQFGLEASAVVAGHKSIKTTQIYAPGNNRLRDQAALELG